MVRLLSGSVRWRIAVVRRARDGSVGEDGGILGGEIVSPAAELGDVGRRRGAGQHGSSATKPISVLPSARATLPRQTDPEEPARISGSAADGTVQVSTSIGGAAGVGGDQDRDRVARRPPAATGSSGAVSVSAVSVAAAVGSGRHSAAGPPGDGRPRPGWSSARQLRSVARRPASSESLP